MKKQNTYLHSLSIADGFARDYALKYEALNIAICGALNTLTKDWERCDKETGRECRWLKCHLATHRAVAILERALIAEATK